MDVIDEIKDRIDIVELISESVKLRKTGKNYIGFCPFHANTRTPAFVVFPETATWRCFGACNEGGDVFRFVMKKEGWDFPEALRNLAERAGVQLRPRRPEEQESEEENSRLRELLESAIAFYRHKLIDTESGDRVMEYLRGRSLSDSTLEAFEIGYAPDSWEETLGYLKGKSFSEKELIDTGIVSQRESGGIYDRFRNRIMIPIRDARGRMTGFGARIVNPDDTPKYLNSPQTKLFDKGRLLYGLEKARKAIRSANQAVIVEGYLDVIGLHQAGHENAVSPMGTALNENQLRTLKRYSRRIVLALDPDIAGNQATLRGLSVAREALDHEADPVFNPRGLVGYASRLDADIRIMTLPAGKDPDEVVVDDPDAWPRLLKQAQPVVSYVLDVLTAGKDLDDPRMKAEIARQVLPLVEDVADPVEREAYRQAVARRLRVDERALFETRPRRGRRRRRKPAGKQKIERLIDNLDKESPLEEFCLGILLRKPELLYTINREYQSLNMERLTARAFCGTDRQVIFQVIKASLMQEEDEPQKRCLDELDASLSAGAQAMRAEVEGLDLEAPGVMDKIMASFLRLRMRHLSAVLTQLTFQLQLAQETSSGEGEMEEVSLRDLENEFNRLYPQKLLIEKAYERRRGIVQESVSAPG
jgi:DNA primase